jgi:hypothetical protein
MKIPVLYQLETFFRKQRTFLKDIKSKNSFLKVKKQQDELFERNFKNTKKMIVFVNFADNHFCGGVMTIFHFAKISRQMKEIHGCDVLHANFFNEFGRYYIKQDRFKNNETIYRLSQVMEHAENLDTLILHVPEILMEEFSQKLTKKHRTILQKVPNLQINVLNQNIEVFSPPETWSDLWELTDNITQTTGFDRYTTQEVCDKFNLPLYKLIGYNDIFEGNEKIDFNNKEKLIIYSPDPHPARERVLNFLKQNLQDFRFQEINNLTFDEFIQLSQKAMFSLTFGEGYDGYFVMSSLVGGIGISVYNEIFFPTTMFKDFKTVYNNYDELILKLIDDINYYIDNPEKYNEDSQKQDDLAHKFFYNKELTYRQLESFYKKEPLFLPSRSLLLNNKRK